jgi:hypothetical protein
MLGFGNMDIIPFRVKGKSGKPGVDKADAVVI